MKAGKSVANFEITNAALVFPLSAKGYSNYIGIPLKPEKN